MKQGCFFVCCNQKKTRGENLFTLKKFGKGEILMHSWILTIVVRCFNKGLELPWRLLTLDSKFQESCEFFQLRMTIYVTWPPCLGCGCGVARVQYSVVPLHDSCGNVGQNKASLAIVGMPYVWTSHHFSLAKMRFHHTYCIYFYMMMWRRMVQAIQVIVDRWMLSLLFDSIPTYRAEPVPVVAQWLCPHTATSKE